MNDSEGPWKRLSWDSEEAIAASTSFLTRFIEESVIDAQIKALQLCRENGLVPTDDQRTSLLQQIADLVRTTSWSEINKARERLMN